MAERSDAYFLDLLAEHEAEEEARERAQEIWEAEQQLELLKVDPLWVAGFRLVDSESFSAGRGRDGLPRRRPSREFSLMRVPGNRALRIVNGELQPGRLCFDNGRLVKARSTIYPDVLAKEFLEGLPDEDRTADALLLRVEQNQRLFERSTAIVRSARRLRA